MVQGRAEAKRDEAKLFGNGDFGFWPRCPTCACRRAWPTRAAAARCGVIDKARPGAFCKAGASMPLQVSAETLPPQQARTCLARCRRRAKDEGSKRLPPRRVCAPGLRPTATDSSSECHQRPGGPPAAAVCRVDRRAGRGAGEPVESLQPSADPEARAGQVTSKLRPQGDGRTVSLRWRYRPGGRPQKLTDAGPGSPPFRRPRPRTRPFVSQRTMAGPGPMA